MAIINSLLRLSDIVEKKRFDSEYFQPKYVTNEIKIRNTPNGSKKLSQIAYITDGDHSTRRYTKTGVPFLTSENFTEFSINYETDRYISTQYEKTLERSRAEKNAIFITKTGKYYGEAAICLDDEPKFNIPADVGKIRIINNTVSPFFVVAFLNSKYGNISIRRENSGGTRDRITLVNLGNVEIPIFNDPKTEVLVMEFVDKLYHSKKMYFKAKTLLEDELKVEEIIKDESKYSMSSFANVSLSHRLDPQHFQTKFNNLINHLSNFSCEKIKDIRTYNRRGIQPIYDEKGSINVVNSQHIGKLHLKYDSLQKTSESIFYKAPEGHIKENDLLIYTTGAYVGQTNVYLKETPALASNHVNILRIKPEIDSIYMGMIFQSVVGKYQTEMYSRGSAQAELYPSDIDKFIVPILSAEVQERIGNMVRESLIAEDEAKYLIEQIKLRIENLIEGVDLS